MIVLAASGLVFSSFHWFKRPHFSGYTDTFYVYLSAPSLGYLNKRYVMRGQPVKAGERLFEIDAQPEHSQRLAATAFVKQMEKTLIDLKRPRRKPEIAAIEYQILQTDENILRIKKHFERLVQLSKHQFVDEDTLYTNEKMMQELLYQKKQLEENLKLSHLGARQYQIKAQQSAVNAAIAKLNETNWYIQHKIGCAPNNGYIFDTFYVEGELVPAAKPVMSMVVPENNYVEFFVSAKDVSQLKLGQMINYFFYGDKIKKAAKINYISQNIEYMPPVLFTQYYQEELVFRVRASPMDKINFPLGQPVEVIL
jgi:HlyD family secretion protein